MLHHVLHCIQFSPETSDRWAVITFKAKLKPHADPNRQKTETITVTSIISECKEKRRPKITLLGSTEISVTLNWLQSMSEGNDAQVKPHQ